MKTLERRGDVRMSGRVHDSSSRRILHGLKSSDTAFRKIDEHCIAVVDP